MKENATPIKILETKWRELVAPYKEEALEELKKLIAIDSVLDESTATKEMPFGKGVEEALNYVAELGKRLGFHVDRCDNYVTELTYGEGEKTLDIYAHVDVVPVDKEKWIHNPFELNLEEDNVMYGRGTSDDKGPGIACLYAVKALMDHNMLGGYRLRFLFGGNEENGSLCLEHYFKEMHKEYPTMGFSPDAEYPLIFAEKSIYAYEAINFIDIPFVDDFSLGSALNIVLAEASCVIHKPEEEIKVALDKYLEEHTEVKATIKENKVMFTGKPCHGSTPWNGVNAGLHMLNFLGDFLSIRALNTVYEQYNDGMGNNIGGNYKDQYFSETSYNVGKISYSDGKVTLSVNLRFPAGMDIDKILTNVCGQTRAIIKNLGGSDGFIMNPDSDLVKILLNAYQEETGDYESKPLAIGGGTYARESKNSIAFGAQFINRDYRMHGNDEFFPLSDFYDNMQIYANAIYHLSEHLRNAKEDN